MRVEISYYSEIGSRENNEDMISVTESDATLLAMAADGLGGDGCGELASKKTVSTVVSELLCEELNVNTLVRAVQHANSDVIKMQTDGAKMKTTVAVCWMNETTAVTANVGDTRIYHIRRRKIVYQSMDHSVAQLAVLGGVISADEIRTTKDRNKLVRAIGSQQDIQIDTKVLELLPGDYILICTDGFWEHVREDEICLILSQVSTASEWLRQMRMRVEEAGGNRLDNHSAIAKRII